MLLSIELQLQHATTLSISLGPASDAPRCNTACAALCVTSCSILTLQVPALWMAYLDSISRGVKVIVVGTPTAGIANQETAAVRACGLGS